MATKTKKKPAAKKQKPKARPKAEAAKPSTNGHHDPESFPKDRAGTPAKVCPRCEKADLALDATACACGHSFTDAPSEPDAEEAGRFRAKVEEFEKQCQAAESEYLDLKEQTKEAKEVFDGKVSEMRKFIRGANEKLPLFDGQKPAPQPGDEAWRQDPIDVLTDSAIVGDKAVSEAIVAKLRAAEILTIGDLGDYTDNTRNGGYERRLTDIAGIGQAADEKIGEAQIAYFAWRAEKAPPSPADEAAPPETNPPSGETAPSAEATSEPSGETEPPEDGDEE